MKHSLLLKWGIALLWSMLMVGNASALTITGGTVQNSNTAGAQYAIYNDNAASVVSISGSANVGNVYHRP